MGKTIKSHDKLNRRHRMKPVSTGKCVSPTKRDLIWFQKVHEHGPLSSSFLHAFSKHLCRSSKRARDRLTDLFNEDQTPHGGAYFARPWQQFATFDSRYQELVYELTPASQKALQEHGAWHSTAGGAAGPWKHRYMVAAITSSIELATLARADLNYIPQTKLLKRAQTTLRCTVPFQNPSTGKLEKRDLIPDAVFGLEYINNNQSSYRFFIVEADRGTEPTTTSRLNRKSHLRNFLQYREFVGNGGYKKHFNLTSGMLVLNVVSHPRTMTAMLDLLANESPRGNSYQLFLHVEGFGRTFKPASSPLNLIDTDWKRVGTPPIKIA